MTKALSVFAAALLLAACATSPQPTTTARVKVTPLGSHDGEFCARDRAIVFEDPDGTRILYDAGFTVRGADDPRLGRIDAVLLTHVHGDHLGPAHQPEANAGTCASPQFTVRDTPYSNTVKIAVAKKAKLVVGAELNSYFATVVAAAGGDPRQVVINRFGSLQKVGGVSIATVPAVHTNGLAPEFLDKELGDALAKNGLTAYVGPPNGYVVKFSNGLVAYLSGDTGLTAEQDLVVRRYYKANFAVINIGDVFTTGPAEAAYVIDEMVKPTEVIMSHANEVATSGGKVVAGSRTDQFIKAVKVPARVPLSGKTMEFDGGGRCVAGC
ncbi:MAG TPA: MBL fold metallo-hydrolase [Burkholderiaceae bacterium]|nr:MBL fold metallo-hydrolase [Burkholderiaceae bacterium]